MKKTPGPYGYTSKCIQTFREEITSILQYCANFYRENRTPSKSLYEICITLIPKPYRNFMRQENYKIRFPFLTVTN